MLLLLLALLALFVSHRGSRLGCSARLAAVQTWLHAYKTLENLIAGHTCMTHSCKLDCLQDMLPFGQDPGLHVLCQVLHGRCLIAWSRVHLSSFAFFCYQVVSLSLSLCRIGVFITLDGAKKAGLLLGQLQVLHCVPCCVCLVKSAESSVIKWSCVLLSSSGLSLSVYIYIRLVQDRLLHPAEGKV